MEETAGERRNVAILIADVADSTVIGEQLGPERSKFLFDGRPPDESGSRPIRRHSRAWKHIRKEPPQTVSRLNGGEKSAELRYQGPEEES
jgi:hypothetical protein